MRQAARQHPDRSRTEPSAAARQLMNVVPSLVRLIRSEMRRHSGIGSIPQFRALTYLERHPGAALGEVAAHLGVTAPSASVLVQRLVRDGLVRRSDRPTERRAVAITLTPRGLVLLRRSRSATRARVAAALAALSSDELATVYEALSILDGLFEQRGGRAG
ncbi:MAG: MarR family transcriptional regulator [Chloroflexota bacterium]|nr:MarR family transcriptional regulator [Chloroflexota bacterium]